MSRIILKISGEALKEDNDIVAKCKLDIILNTIKLLKDKHQIGVVIGGGNFFRGREHEDMEALTRDTIGMLGTVMNALYLKDYLANHNIESVVSTPFKFPNLLENYDKSTLKRLFDNGKIIIFGGGIGLSGYSTDSGTILARDILEANLIIKMTNVDGVYNADPKKDINATKFDYLTYDDVIKNQYQVMDLYAIKKCQNKQTKILVMNINDYAKLPNYFEGQKFGTEVGE